MICNVLNTVPDSEPIARALRRAHALHCVRALTHHAPTLHWRMLTLECNMTRVACAKTPTSALDTTPARCALTRASRA